MSKKKKSNIGDMPAGTAKAHLRKKIIFELLEHMQKNICYWCNKPIVSATEFAIGHLDSNPELFWDLKNLVFAHPSCATGGGIQQEKQMNNTLFDVQLQDKNGNKLPTYNHDGKLYIAGEINQEYFIKITNKSFYRLEAVITVDGRDVLCGEIGDVKNSGYVIEPYKTASIKGFRQNMDEVAAFKFGKPKGAYATKMGSGENVGIIGVAVYMEKENWYWISNIGTLTLTPPLQIKLPQYYHWWQNGTHFYNPFDHQITCDTSEINILRSNNTSNYSTCSTTNGFIKQSSNEEYLSEIGTEYGETKKDSVTNTTFTRKNTEPNEIWLGYYDTKAGLIAKGVPIVEKKEPKAFPNTPERKFCPPPPK